MEILDDSLELLLSRGKAYHPYSRASKGYRCNRSRFISLMTHAKLSLGFRLLGETPVAKNLNFEKLLVFFRTLEPEVAHGYELFQNRVRNG